MLDGKYQVRMARRKTKYKRMELFFKRSRGMLKYNHEMKLVDKISKA